MQQYLDAFSSLGSYAYIIVGVFILGGAFALLSMKMNQNALKKWLAQHPGAVRVSLEAGTNLLTSKEITARVVSGEAAVFAEKTHYTIFAMPGTAVVEVSYTYTRPGVLHKTVSTTWGPAKVELTVEAGKEYKLRFDKKEETFKFEEQ